MSRNFKVVVGEHDEAIHQEFAVPRPEIQIEQVGVSGNSVRIVVKEDMKNVDMAKCHMYIGLPVGLYLNAEEFDAWWAKRGWDEKEKPKVDFSKHALVIKLSLESPGLNVANPCWGATLDQDGDLTIRCFRCLFGDMAKREPPDRNTGPKPMVLFMTVPHEDVKTIDVKHKKWLARMQAQMQDNQRQVDLKLVRKLTHKTSTLKEPLMGSKRFGNQDDFDAWWKKMGWDEKGKPEFDDSKSVLVAVSHDANDQKCKSWKALVWKGGEVKVFCDKFGKIDFHPSGQTETLLFAVPRWSEVKSRD